MKKILFLASAAAVLFSSCSTDNTQDVVGTEAMGTISATAAYQQDATRTELKGRSVVWSKGDALGVFGVSGTQVQFGLVAGEGTASGQFSGNKTFLKEGEPVYAYYPYDKGTSISSSTVELEIMATQTYNPSTNAYGSFDAAQAPAFAYIPELEDADEVKFSFKGAASYLAIPVKGYGVLNKLELEMDGQNLAGTGTLDIAQVDNPATEEDETPALNITGDLKGKITMECGAIELDPFNPVMVMFVVPAGTNINSEITLTAYLNGAATGISKTKPAKSEDKEIKRNMTEGILASATATNPVDGAWSFGLEKKYVISGDNDQAALDFISYAYMAQEDNYTNNTGKTGLDANGSTAEDWAALTEYFGENPYDYTAITFVDKIDLAAFDADAKFAELGSIVNPTSKDKFYRNVLTWYINNEYAIESLYYGNHNVGIIGGNFDEAGNHVPTVINGLTVLGNGIVGSNATTPGAILENLKFTNSTVFAIKDADLGFIAPSYETSNIDNIVIGEGNAINTNACVNRYIGGIFGYAYVDGLPEVTVEALPAFIGTYDVANPKNIGQLYGFLGMNKNLVVDLEANKVVALDIPAVYETYSTNVLDFTNAPADATYATVVAKNAASVVIDGTSYWNGKALSSNVGGNDYFTAEELAYLMNSDAANTVAMTHNIDMQDVKTAVTAGNNRRINIDNKDVFEISNINIEVDGVTGWVSLLGRYAAVENLTVSNLSINIVKSNLLTGVAGLATAGTAKNVTMNGVEINIDKESTFNSNPAFAANNFGGVFTQVDTDDIDNVDVKALVINYAGENNLGARAGIIAGTLNVITNSKGVTLKPFAISGAKGAYAFTNVAKVQGALTNEKSGIDGYKKENNYGTTYAFGTVSVNNAEFAATHQEAILNVANVDFCPWAKAFAAGIVFADGLTSAAAGKVNYDAAKVADYDYAFLTNAPIRASGNTGYKVWGFNKK